MIDKAQKHYEICDKLNRTYRAKNHDYGDSFAQLRERCPNAILVRLYDKYLRLETLLNGATQQVTDESINDTLLDMANYAIMEVIEREVDKVGKAMTVEEFEAYADMCASEKQAETVAGKWDEVSNEELFVKVCNTGICSAFDGGRRKFDCPFKACICYDGNQFCSDYFKENPQMRPELIEYLEKEGKA